MKKQFNERTAETIKLMEKIKKELKSRKPGRCVIADLNKVYADMVDIAMFLGIKID